jgi:lysozyme family protein
MEAESEVEKAKEEFKAKYAKCKSRIEFANRMKIECHKNKATVPSTTSIQLFSEFVKFLNSCTQNKCPYLNCKKESKKVKKEGASKIFLIDREAEED